MESLEHILKWRFWKRNSTGDIEARRWGLGKWENDISEAVGIRSREKSS